jgi:hypothetical protein
VRKRKAGEEVGEKKDVMDYTQAKPACVQGFGGVRERERTRGRTEIEGKRAREQRWERSYKREKESAPRPCEKSQLGKKESDTNIMHGMAQNRLEDAFTATFPPLSSCCCCIWYLFFLPLVCSSLRRRRRPSYSFSFKCT